jgi:predicted GTPase
MKPSSSILNILQTASQFIDSSYHEKLLQDLHLIFKSFEDSTYRIAVLGQFNIGKSTFLNAILGNDILPVKMVRLTGTAIHIKYGKSLAITISLDTGELITGSHLEILEGFAILSPKGYRREDVLKVEGFYPHPILMNGVELMDLPGTNDQRELDDLVKDQLLQVDLVIQVLNARQPFSKCEQDILNQWLSARGVQTFIFVLNRMNEISSPKDRAEVYNHLSSSLRAFKPNLSNGLKSLFRVDALPA